MTDMHDLSHLSVFVMSCYLSSFLVIAEGLLGHSFALGAAPVITMTGISRDGTSGI